MDEPSPLRIEDEKPFDALHSRDMVHEDGLHAFDALWRQVGSLEFEDDARDDVLGNGNGALDVLTHGLGEIRIGLRDLFDLGTARAHDQPGVHADQCQANEDHEDCRHANDTTPPPLQRPQRRKFEFVAACRSGLGLRRQWRRVDHLERNAHGEKQPV